MTDAPLLLSALQTDQKTARAPRILPLFSKRLGSWHISVGREEYDAAQLSTQYDALSHKWARKIDRLGFGAAYAALIQSVAAQPRYALTTPKPHVVDIGIGTGALAGAFCQYHHTPVHLTGVDISPAMLGQAQRNLDALGVHATVIEGSLLALPLADESCDVVLLGHVLEHMLNPHLGMAEIARVLRPGGLVISAITRPTALGAVIQLLWRTQRISESRAKALFTQGGLIDISAIPLASARLAHQLSMGYAARKPGA
ncbi:methyltransferase domain-containing protein [Cognatishimia sp. SS12]|uniref:class I SAM-dependent methyltransferase n=1 Tax=Cognatishimia sp. SS12 TaxID=2979465 RepID=UPI00232A9E17|nr:class I SAM-dependent methyltransferase [Cognatishimia sp. SS12]MDC0737054.1 methyltransferase domain-containing protein [Cognatishimia sp. SS12]